MRKILSFATLLFLSQNVFADAPVKWPASYRALITVMNHGQKVETVNIVNGENIRIEAPPGSPSFIVRPDRNVMYSIHAAVHGYQESPINPAMRKRLPGPDGTWTLKGEEQVNGKLTEKYELRDPNNPQSPPLTFWLAKADHLPMKESNEGGTYTVEWNITAGPQEPALFEPPADFKKLPEQASPTAAPH